MIPPTTVTANGSIEKARAAMRTAQLQIAQHNMFLGSVGLGIKMVPSLAIPTIATDANTIYFNPKALETPPFNDPAVRRFCIGHVTLHIALGHPFRLPPGAKNTHQMDKWAQAQDIVVNNMLLSIQSSRISACRNPNDRKEEIQKPLFRPPSNSDGTPNIAYASEYIGWSAERIYMELITQDPSKIPNSAKVACPQPPKEPIKENDITYSAKPIEDGQWDSAIDSHIYYDPSTNEAQEIMQRVHVNTLQAISRVKAMGGGTGDALRPIEGEMLHEPSLYEAMYEFMTAVEESDLSWKKPSRRWLAHGKIMPSPDDDLGATVVVGIDVSGSVGQKELSEFLGIIKASLSSGLKLNFHIVSCDTQITKHIYASWKNPEDLEKIKDLPGGGGTDFRPIFAWQQENCRDAAAVIIFTDLCGIFPTAVETPTLWVVDNALRGRMSPPFGQTVYYRPGA
jgi:predicted metal-dependent peptidase